MSVILTTWMPKRRTVAFPGKPEWVPDWVYIQAKAAKQSYNADWEFWVWEVSKQHNCSQAKAEDACIRGIKKEILRQYLVYGAKVGKWFEEYLDMGDIFKKVSHPEYLPKLDDTPKKG